MPRGRAGLALGATQMPRRLKRILPLTYPAHRCMMTMTTDVLLTLAIEIRASRRRQPSPWPTTVSS